MKSIYVPTDFSECAMNAFNLALDIAVKNKAELHVAHGYNPSDEMIASDWAVPFQGVPGSMSGEQIHNFIEEHNRYIANEFDKLKVLADEKNVKCSFHQVTSSRFDVLSDKAHELHADLVVMGSHGVSGVRETLLGSNTQRFVRNSVVPVLTVKKAVPNFKIYKVAFVSTFLHEGEDSAYQQFRTLFEKQPIHTDFVFINTPNNFITTPMAHQRIKTFLMDTWPSAYETHVFNDLTVEQGILNFCDTHDIDMIVMATHGHGGMSRWVYHSSTEQLINHAERPILSFRLEN